MGKDFDRWNKRKKKIEYYLRTPNFRTGDVWWCSAGINVGVEIDGKHEGFERPVYILKKCGTDMFIGIPCTSSKEGASYMYSLKIKDTIFGINFSQVKAMSSKRLIKKITRSSTGDTVLQAFIAYLNESPLIRRAIFGAKWQK